MPIAGTFVRLVGNRNRLYGGFCFCDTWVLDLKQGFAYGIADKYRKPDKNKDILYQGFHLSINTNDQRIIIRKWQKFRDRRQSSHEYLISELEAIQLEGRAKKRIVFVARNETTALLEIFDNSSRVGSSIVGVGAQSPQINTI